LKKSTPIVVEQRQWRGEIVQQRNREGPRQHWPRDDLICSPHADGAPAEEKLAMDALQHQPAGIIDVRTGSIALILSCLL
jgi:hypothetical protein